MQSSYKRLVFFAGLFGICGWLLLPVLPGIAWGIVFAVSTHPAYTLFRSAVAKQSATTAASLFTFLIGGMVATSVAVLGPSLLTQGQNVLQQLRSLPSEAVSPPAWLLELPIVGDRIFVEWRHYASDGIGLAGKLEAYSAALLVDWVRMLAPQAAGFLLTFAIALFCTFFLYRDGLRILDQVRIFGREWLGDEWDEIIESAHGATHAVMNGTILLGVLEGFLLGFTYTFAGLPAPLLLGIVAGVATIIPGAAAAIHIVLTAAVFMFGTFFDGLILALSGVLVLLILDNIARPSVIGGSAHVPFFWVMVGLLGGASTFGALGVFLGPIAVGVTMQVWRDFVKRHSP